MYIRERWSTVDKVHYTFNISADNIESFYGVFCVMFINSLIHIAYHMYNVTKKEVTPVKNWIQAPGGYSAISNDRSSSVLFPDSPNVGESENETRSRRRRMIPDVNVCMC